jgi:hypothetical protein
MNVENRHKHVERRAAFQADVRPDLSIGAESVENVNQPDCAPQLLRRFGFERPPLVTTVVGGRDRSRDPKNGLTWSARKGRRTELRHDAITWTTSWAEVGAGEISSYFKAVCGTVVELRGLEPLASSLRTRRSPN